VSRNTEWEVSFMLLDYSAATVIVSAKIRLTYCSVLCFFFGDYQSVSVLLEELPLHSKLGYVSLNTTVYLLHKQLHVSAIERSYHQVVYKNKMKIFAIVCGFRSQNLTHLPLRHLEARYCQGQTTAIYNIQNGS